MDKQGTTSGVSIERGRIAEKNGLKYKVESYTRNGVKTRWIEAISHTHEHVIDGKAYTHRQEYMIGDEVYFFMFADGRGMVLGRMIRD